MIYLSSRTADDFHSFWPDGIFAQGDFLPISEFSFVDTFSPDDAAHISHSVPYKLPKSQMLSFVLHLCCEKDIAPLTLWEETVNGVCSPDCKAIWTSDEKVGHGFRQDFYHVWQGKDVWNALPSSKVGVRYFSPCQRKKRRRRKKKEDRQKDISREVLSKVTKYKQQEKK